MFVLFSTKFNVVYYGAECIAITLLDYMQQRLFVLSTPKQTLGLEIVVFFSVIRGAEMESQMHYLNTYLTLKTGTQ